MRSNGQRQDVAFLALAVAVLAVAVALFVGMKAIQRDRPKEPEPEPAEQVETAEPVVEEPAKGESGRDPFKAQGGSAKGPGAVGQSHEMKLVGIVMERGDKPMAIIHSGSKRYYARLGERAAGYTVVSIGEDRATLDKDGDRLTLVLREPPPEE
ncbi:MAG TPA: hypothetical protein VMY87_04225 [Armatimonadota bacterium]|nr:hypothetical protein [Armatimonadota bacterium]